MGRKEMLRISCRRAAIIAVAIFPVLLLGSLSIKSQSSQIASGLTYLKSTQSTDGSWGGSSTSLNHIFPTTSAALEALRALESSTSANQTSAIQFLNSQTVDVNPFLAGRIKAIAGTSSTAGDLN